jgi:hypothetical protein
MAAFAAQPLFQHDVGHGVIGALSAFSGVEDILLLVEAGVAGLAVGDSFDIFNDFVLNFHVTLAALDLVGRNVGGMHKVGIAIFLKPLCFPVALVAVFPGNSAVADDRIGVAFIAAPPVVENGSMVEARCFFGDEVIFLMTVRAIADPGIVFALFEVADKTGARGDRDMLALDDLGMATGAAEGLASF